MKDIRQTLRRTIQQKRHSLSESEKTAGSLRLSEKLAQHPKIQCAHHVGIFLSTNDEINTQPTIQVCWQKQISLYVPVIHPTARGYMQFFPYTPQTPLIRNRLGIFEPEWNETCIFPALNLDVMLTPLVAFDRHANRLGMGGGYYDRLLGQPESTHIYTLGIAFDCQEVDEIPCEPWDMPLQEIITPTQHIIRKKTP